MLKHACAALTLLLLAACAPTTETRVASFVDPAYRAGPLSSLVVQVNTPALAERQAIEQTAAAGLAAANVAARPSLALLPPTRDFDAASSRRAMIASGAQAVLVVTPLGKTVLQDYVPPAYFPGSVGFVRRDGFVEHVQSPGFYQGGYVVNQPQAQYSAALYTLPQFRRVWTAQFTTSGYGGADFDVVARGFADQLVLRLARDRLIAASPAPAP